MFLGEYCSFQSLITSALQKASILGRCGEGGMRWRLEGDCNLDFEGLDGGVTGLEGGVTGLDSFPVQYALSTAGAELQEISSYSIPVSSNKEHTSAISRRNHLDYQTMLEDS